MNVIGRFKSAGAMTFVTKTSVAEELHDPIKSSVQIRKLAMEIIRRKSFEAVPIQDGMVPTLAGAVASKHGYLVLR